MIMLQGEMYVYGVNSMNIRLAHSNERKSLNDMIKRKEKVLLRGRFAP